MLMGMPGGAAANHRPSLSSIFEGLRADLLPRKSGLYRSNLDNEDCSSSISSGSARVTVSSSSVGQVRPKTAVGGRHDQRNWSKITRME